MPVRHIDEIGQLYAQQIRPTRDNQVLTEDNHVASPMTGGAFDEKGGHNLAKDTGPESSENFEAATNDPENKKNKKTAYNEETFSHPVKNNDEETVKKESNKINNSTMRQNSKNKSTFDRLYEDVMDDEGLDIGLGDDELGGEEELGGEDEMGDTISVDLPRDVAEQLHTALGELLGNGEDEMEDLGDAEGDLGDEFGGGLGEEGAYRESHVELQAAPDATGALQGTNNKVQGSGHAAGGGGGASGDASGEVDGGKPKAAADGKAGLQGKNNKVGGKVTAGKDLFKA